MSKLTLKIATPIILAGIFCILVFIAAGYGQSLENFYNEPGFYIILGFLIVYVFFFGFSTGQSLSSPIKKLLDKAKDLSEGNLSSRAYLETKDELSELANVFNKLADELKQSRDQEEATEKSVDIKVRARTQALEETINALEQKVRNRTVELENMIKNLEKFQGESTIKEAEIEDLRKQINSLNEGIDKNNYSKKSGEI